MKHNQLDFVLNRSVFDFIRVAFCVMTLCSLVGWGNILLLNSAVDLGDAGSIYRVIKTSLCTKNTQKYCKNFQSLIMIT
jgi:hypothetical protein